MKITNELLKNNSACKEGIELFSQMFPDGFDLSLWTQEKQLEIIKTELRKYLGWAYYNKIIPLWSMSGSNLSGSDLSGSDLSGSNLSGSDLRGSNLRGSNLSGSNLRGIYIDRDAKINGYKWKNGRLVSVW